MAKVILSGGAPGVGADLVRDLRYPAIDGLRFYAAFLVFLCHCFGAIAIEMLHMQGAELQAISAPLSTRVLYELGSVDGVDLFFVISGFLMGRMLLDAKRPV